MVLLDTSIIIMMKQPPEQNIHLDQSSNFITDNYSNGVCIHVQEIALIQEGQRARGSQCPEGKVCTHSCPWGTHPVQEGKCTGDSEVS